MTKVLGNRRVSNIRLVALVLALSAVGWVLLALAVNWFLGLGG